MPVHDLGYREWIGKRNHPLIRPLYVARSGIMLIWRRKMLKLLLMVAWLPIIIPSLGVFCFEQAISDPQYMRPLSQLLRGPLQRPDLAVEMLQDPVSVRHEFWSIMILGFFRAPQLYSMILLIGLIAPLLVSYDLRSKAYLQYFSRPLSPSEYILGKSAVIWFFLGMITTLPGLVLYLLGILLSPELSVVTTTWDIPIRILLASVALIVPTTALALSYSACTVENRYASFAWFATWIMGFVAHQILSNPPGSGRGRGRMGDRMIDTERWHLISPYHTLGKVESWIFGFDTGEASVWPAIFVLLAITAIGTFFVRSRLIAKLSI